MNPPPTQGREGARAIDVDCPDCGAPAGDACQSKRYTDLKFARTEIKSLHPGRYFEAQMARGAVAHRARRLSEVLDFAFDELLWISEAPNREMQDEQALALCYRARDAVIKIEAKDPERKP